MWFSDLIMLNDVPLCWGALVDDQPLCGPSCSLLTLWVFEVCMFKHVYMSAPHQSETVEWRLTLLWRKQDVCSFAFSFVVLTVQCGWGVSAGSSHICWLWKNKWFFFPFSSGASGPHRCQSIKPKDQVWPHVQRCFHNQLHCNSLKIFAHYYCVLQGKQINLSARLKIMIMKYRSKTRVNLVRIRFCQH